MWKKRESGNPKEPRPDIEGRDSIDSGRLKGAVGIIRSKLVLENLFVYTQI